MAGTITDKQWQDWGLSNPYLGVLGVETRSLVDGDVRERFFGTGERDVAIALDIIEAREPGFSRKGGRVLDFGCGVGRLMAAFARRGFEVAGVDISPAMIAEARKNLAHAQGARWAERVEDFTSEQFDLVHSFIVIQHIRPRQGMPIMRQLMRRVRRGGYAAIQFTLGTTDRRLWALNWLRYRLPPLQMAYNLVRRRPIGEPIMELNRYDLHAVLRLCEEEGIEDVTIVRHGGDTHRGVMIVGRKGRD